MSVSMKGHGGSPLSYIMLASSGANWRLDTLFLTRAAKSLLFVIHALIVPINAFILLLVFPFRRRTPPVSSPVKAPKKEAVDAVAAAAASVVDGDVVARRALAIRRVVEDSGDGVAVRDYAFFTTSKGVTLFTQSWTPVSGNIRGTVVILHGLNEHSGRYGDFAKKLNLNGYKVYGLDWIGHGGSDGLHAYVHSIDDVVRDLKLFLERLLSDCPDLPLFCFGHSTGGAIILRAMLDPKIDARVAGVVLTSPAVGVQPSHPIFMALAPIISFLLPTYQLGAANKNGVVVSRDPDALVAKYSDPLVYTGYIRVKTGYEILCNSYYLNQNLKRVRVPFFVLHGAADGVTDPKGSWKLYEEASSTDKKIKLFEGCLHDLLFEPEKEVVASDIIEWLNFRVSRT